MGRKDWPTPWSWFTMWQTQYAFSVDAAASPLNTKLGRYWTVESNGLKQSWSGEKVFCNPPYEGLEAWVEKTIYGEAELAFLLVLSNTDTGWFHRHLWDKHESRWRPGIHAWFTQGRIPFGDVAQNTRGSLIVIQSKHDFQRPYLHPSEAGSPSPIVRVDTPNPRL